MSTVIHGEKREFRLDKNILWSIVKSQAGTVGKAVLDLVMNSIDAGATQVKIKLTQTHLSVSDDGKGFASRQEIEDFFECFGREHTPGDAIFGRFRMGRGQIMAFSRNTWHSGSFRMHVDIRGLGLAYDLVTLPKSEAGCRIEAELYDPLTPAEQVRLQDELRNLCKYAPIPVLVNGVRVSVEMDTMAWTMIDDDAYYLLRPASRSLEAYNLGVFVRGYYGNYGIGGVIVSRRPLEINFARNDILLGECQTWRRISTKVKEYAKRNEEKRPAQNEAYRELLMARLLAGSFDTGNEYVEALCEGKVFTEYSGKHYSLEKLAQAIERAGNKLVVVDDHSLKADRVQQKQLAVVLSPKMLERAGHLPMADVFERFRQNLDQFENIGGYRLRNVLEWLAAAEAALTPLEVVSGSINEAHDIVLEKTLTKEEQITLNTIFEASRCIASATVLGHRRIRVCKSETVDGFTDGKDVIFIERKFLKFAGWQGGLFRAFQSIGMLLLHEYLHDADDSTGHGHPAEFYERFHDIASNSDALHGFAYGAVRIYLSARRRAGLRLRQGDLHALDLVTVETESPVPSVSDAPVPGDGIAAAANDGAALQVNAARGRGHDD